jgi:maltose alpha-D-glucosyltransferase/alpha-amylase
MFTLPGTPVLRYGDEIGMGDNLELPERYCARTPMQWSGEPQGGFSQNEKTYLPIITDGGYGYEKVNVAEQRRDPGSLLNWMERIIRMRQETQEIGWGDFRILDVGDKSVLAMRYEWRNNAVLFLHNLHPEGRGVSFRSGTGKNERDKLVNLLSDDHSEADRNGLHHVTLEPYGYRWFRVGGLDYILKRSEL